MHYIEIFCWIQLLLKKNKEPISCLTAYSKPLANILDGNVDLVLVGDSLGTTLYGMKNTRSVNLEMMKNHGKAVVTAQCRVERV